VRIGKLSPFSIQFLRDLKQFFNVTFKLKADAETTTTLCVWLADWKDAVVCAALCFACKH